MTKASPILITKIHPLDHMPEAEKAVVRRFLFDCLRGLDEKHHRRWMRLWGRFWKAEPGEVFQLLNLVDRCGPYHRMHMSMEQALFDRQDRFTNQEMFRLWLKTGAGWGTYTLVNGRMRFVPNSLGYEECSDDEMREVHENMVAYLRTPKAQRKLWPHLPADRRTEMIESIVDPREQAA